jgi:hypothetical protein
VAKLSRGVEHTKQGRLRSRRVKEASQIEGERSPDVCGTPSTSNQTVMSRRISIAFVDFSAFSFGEIAFVAFR